MDQSDHEYKKLPSNLELATITAQPTKRPPSYSDSFFIVKQQKQKQGSHSNFEFLDLANSSTSDISNLATVTHVQPELPTSPSHSRTPEIALGFLFHITLISVFESLFFYYFISRSEDKGILTTVNNLLHEVTRTCPWPTNQTVILRDLFKLFVNTTSLQIAASSALQSRTAYNNAIFLQSWMYVVGLSSTCLLMFAIAKWRSYLTRSMLLRILLENIGLVLLLGAYEFLFFKTIIYKYDSISVLEIENYAANQLQTICDI